MHTLPLGSLVTDGRRVGRLEAYRPANMADVRFTQTLNGAAFNVVERHPIASLRPVTVQPQAPRENPAKGLRKLITLWEKTPQARPLLSVLRGAVLNPDFTPDRTRSIPADFFPEALVDHKDVQLVIGRGGTIVLLAADSPRRGADTLREAMRSGRRIALTGPRGGLAPAQRETLDTGAFAIPERRAWPINDRRHAEIAVQYMKRGFGKKREYPRIKAAIQERYPGVPLSNPAPDVQDPENIQFRRVVAGVLRSLVRKEHGLRSPPRSEEMTAADLREEERLLLALPVATRKKLTSQAYAIATRQGQKHGWLVPGSQKPTEKAAQRSEERMLLDPLEQQKNRFYEVALASQRKSGFYRVVPREYTENGRTQTRYYVEPAEDPNRPVYFLSAEKAEARKDAMNEKVAVTGQVTLRNPRMRRNPTQEKDRFEFADLLGELPGETSVVVTSEPSDFTPAPSQIERLLRTITANIAKGPQGQVNLSDPERPQPFYDIERIRLQDAAGVDPMTGQTREYKRYAVIDSTAPVEENDRFRFVLYLPKRYTYVPRRQMSGDTSLLTPQNRIREELGTRLVGKRGEKFEKEIDLPYSQEARYLSQAINVPDQILSRFFSPFGTKSQMWEKYKTEKNWMRKRGLRPTMAKMWVKAPKSDVLQQLGRGRWNDRKKQFVEQVNQNYVKYYTTNADLFLFTILNFNNPAVAFVRQHLALLVKSAAEAAFVSQVKASEARKYAGMTDEQILVAKINERDQNALAVVDNDVRIITVAVQTAQKNNSKITAADMRALQNLDIMADLPRMEDVGVAVNRLTQAIEARNPDIALVTDPLDGRTQIVGLGSLASFASPEDAIEWLDPRAVYLRDMMRAYQREQSAPVLPITAAGIPFSAGESVIEPLARMVQAGFEAALEVGEAQAEAKRTEGRIRRAIGVSLPAPEPVAAPKEASAPVAAPPVNWADEL